MEIENESTVIPYGGTPPAPARVQAARDTAHRYPVTHQLRPAPEPLLESARAAKRAFMSANRQPVIYKYLSQRASNWHVLG